MTSPAALLAVFLTVVVGSAAGVVLWWDAQRGAEEGQAAVRAAVPAVPPLAQRMERARQTSEWPKPEPRVPEPSLEEAPLELPRNGLFRCEHGGKTVYQGEPCGRGQKQTEVAGGTVSVVAAVGPASGTREGTATDPAPETGTSFGRIAAPKFDLVDHERCAVLRSEIQRVDALARHRSTERLRERRRGLVREMDDLQCETWPS